MYINLIDVGCFFLLLEYSRTTLGNNIVIMMYYFVHGKIFVFFTKIEIILLYQLQIDDQK